jgi:hypothetical protein
MVVQSIKQFMKQVIPSVLWRPISNLYWSWYNRGRHKLSAAVSVRRRKDAASLRSYHNKYSGRRCFVIGNGPSLRKTDLSFLRDEITFGANRLYLNFPEMGFTSTFLVITNILVVEQCALDLKKLIIPKFITWRARKWMKDDARTIFLDTDYTLPETFAQEVSGRVYEGNTVTYTSLQLAYHMGFSKVILIGVDHHYDTQGPANTVVVSQGEDPNHFHPDYFGKGFRWQLPDLVGSERAYKMARENFARDGREILDATIGGRLTIFPKVNYEDLF